MENREFSSFRDPAGYVYYKDGKVYRRINKCYFKQYDYLMKSGLYDELVDHGYLIRHKEIKRNREYIIIEVEKVPFVSYPYEWCFEEIKDAALLTLNIQKIALKYNMILKDASGYNVQFLKGKVVFIDTLSFDFYEEGVPWGAYGQFCRHFMAPLILMRYVDENLGCLLKNYIDGIPIPLANNILKSRGGFIGRQHIKWHSKAILNNNSSNSASCAKISKNNIINMVDMMIRQINKLKRLNVDTEWDKYYDNTNYSDIADKCKVRLVKKYLDNISLSRDDIIWDLGANDGKYSRIASNYANVVSFDIDINAVNRNYNLVKNSDEDNILPLILDLTNPTPAIGFGGSERKGINDRAPVRCIMALALIHHIAISNNVPFIEIAVWFSKLCEYLIIEFVPKDDSQVEKLLRTRRDIFDNYNKDSFERSFSKYFKIIKNDSIKGSKRSIYLMRSTVLDEE